MSGSEVRVLVIVASTGVIQASRPVGVQQTRFPRQPAGAESWSARIVSQNTIAESSGANRTPQTSVTSLGRQ